MVYLYFICILSSLIDKALANDLSLPAIPQRSPASYYLIEPQLNGLNMDYLAKLEELTSSEYRIHTEDFIPLTLPQYSSDGRLIFGKVLRHSLQTWVESTERDNSNLQRGAKSLNQQLSQNINLSPFSHEHSLRLKFKAIQGIAILRYKGYFNASVYYFSLEQTANLEITQNWKDKILYLDSSKNYLGETTTAGIRWGF